MIFEFADASDDMIREAGGDKWLEQRAEKNSKLSEGTDLLGIIPVSIPSVHSGESEKATSTKEDVPKSIPTPPPLYGELDIKAFNGIPDKMSRGTAKKVFTASKRAGKDKSGILADVTQVLSDAGKMTDDIQSILNGLSKSSTETKVEIPAIESEIKGETAQAKDKPKVDIKEFDIKDLNAIDDKMARGTAKKAFLIAKRTGEDKVMAVRKSLLEVEKLDSAIEKLLDSFLTNAIEDSETIDTVKSDIPSEDASNEPPTESKSSEDLPLFEITELNGIEDRVARGTAKKVYLAGKKNEKTRIEILQDIRSDLEGMDKMNELVISILSNLEKNN